MMRNVVRVWLATSLLLVTLPIGAGTGGAAVATPDPALERANPLRPLPEPPLGIEGDLAELTDPPTPERVRLGRWLFFDPRLSADGSVACASCHRPHHGFSEPTAVSTGVGGKQGARKAPPLLNLAFNLESHMFWDGRASTIEEQAVGPMINPVEMAMPDHGSVVDRVGDLAGYRGYFAQAFGDGEITIDRIARAIGDYERTRFSGNSAWDRWRAEPDPEDAAIDVDAVTDLDGTVHLEQIEFTDGKYVSAQVKLGHYVFHEKAFCNQCHLGPNLTDTRFHNLGVGWNPLEERMADWGRYEVTKQDADRGAFKTPTLREVSLRAPYMHDGSVATLREVVELYARGGERNPWLSPKVREVDLSETEIDALVAFLEALDGEGYADTPPALFPGAAGAPVKLAFAIAHPCAGGCDGTCGGPCAGGGRGPMRHRAGAAASASAPPRGPVCPCGPR